MILFWLVSVWIVITVHSKKRDTPAGRPGEVREQVKNQGLTAQ